ncbi:glycoside hydrolase family 47 protein [Cyberlindnera jadinii NRRL Y-1542]|uniref:alpha-1,2-Mannosidase n=1 Tax=Cyberlindnera jadinii (strain ATCC 18201 / CBS 1600 / BCRC 20928 / JCM 3617 / NBRC 0987 / NRRL Y-1542) TaxID=983966 RepID=A0A1E4RXW6_CYBJN|nr:seven-hairpin glycosidase [Cyberlindnera jadinii NRRL Y-1542]ODV72108.1 seven-hairpin glycosidase [Cyberlindnera jadinii NRRL Y-1542]
MADDELPPITDTPAHDEVAAPQKLGLWEDIVEKNKYFPWLGVEKVETKQGSVLPDEYFNNQKAVDLRKHKKKYRYPVGKENYFKLPRVARDASYPSIQATEFSDGGAAMPSRLARVKEAFMKSWKIYKDYGYGHDEVRPISHEVLDPFNGWSATLIDSIDTLHLMGEDEEVKEAIKFLQRVNFKQSYRNAIPIFENVIRVLGGMLTAYDITEDKSVLQNCEDLAHLLMEAFDTPNRMPLLHYEWQSELANRLASTSSSIAELGSLSLEFSKLSQLTGDNEYYDAITRITNALEKSKDNFLLPGLYSNHDSIRSAEGLSQKYSLGGLGDSFYEYLPKMFHLLGGDAKYSQTYKEMYLRAAEHIRKYMLYRPKMVNNPDVLFVSSISVFQRSIDTIIVSPDEDMQHLTCFTGGMLALGSRLFNISEDMGLAEKVTLGCVKLYEELGIMPEVDVFPIKQMEDGSYRWTGARENQPLWLNDARPFYNMRPEAIESVWYMYRTTGDSRWRDYGWMMWQNIERLCQRDGVFTEVDDLFSDVSNTHRFKDAVESFWFSETLKYFYLLFEESSVWSLDDYVFNTEAHPFKLQK